MKYLKRYKIFENYNRFGSGTITESKSYLSAEMFDEDYYCDEGPPPLLSK